MAGKETTGGTFSLYIYQKDCTEEAYIWYPEAIELQITLVKDTVLSTASIALYPNGYYSTGVSKTMAELGIRSS